MAYEVRLIGFAKVETRLSYGRSGGLKKKTSTDVTAKHIPSTI